jgi:teichuronic acid biosynthesis glycosyltransferase TuaC
MGSELLNPEVTYRGRAMRVLSVIPGEPEGALYIFAKRQVAGLQKVGVVNRSFFLTSRLSPWKLFQEWLRFRKEILAFHPDLVHAHYGTITAFFCAIGTRLPLVVYFRGNDLSRHPEISFLRAYTGIFLSHVAALRARHLICVSEQTVRLLWWKHAQASIISSGVDTSIFYPRPREEARAILGWDQEERVVIFNVGKDPLRKRLDLAQAAVDVAMRRCGEINFCLLSGNIDPDRIPLMLNAADCLLVTSDFEGSPNIVKEALACNLPIVSVDVGDVRERLKSTDFSYIVSRDPAKLGEAVAKILNHRKRSNGHQNIIELSLDKTTKRIIRIYQAVLVNKDSSLVYRS